MATTTGEHDHCFCTTNTIGIRVCCICHNPPIQFHLLNTATYTYFQPDSMVEGVHPIREKEAPMRTLGRICSWVDRNLFFVNQANKR